MVNVKSPVKLVSSQYARDEHARLTNDVHNVPAEIDQRVARMKLQALGIRHDELSVGQREYLSTWQAGT